MGKAWTKTVRFELRITPADYRLMRRVAEILELSVAEVLRRLVRAEAKRLEGLDRRDPAKPSN